MSRPAPSSRVSSVDFGNAIEAIKARDVDNLLAAYQKIDEIKLVLRPVICETVSKSTDNRMVAKAFETFRKRRKPSELSMGAMLNFINFDVGSVISDISAWTRTPLKVEGRQASTSGFGVEVAGSIRSVYSSLLSPTRNDKLFSDVSNHPLICTIILSVADKLTSVISYDQILASLLSLPFGQFFIECLIIAKPELFRTAVTTILLSSKLESIQMEPFLTGIVKIYPKAAATIQSLCLKHRRHCFLCLAFICDLPAEKFVSVTEAIFQNLETSSWFISQFQSSVLIDQSVVTKFREKVISIIIDIAKLLETSPTSELVVFANAVLHVFCLMKTSLNIRFPTEHSGELMTLFERTLLLEIDDSTIQFFLITTSMAVCYGDFSASAVKGDSGILTRLSNWLAKMIAKCTGDKETQQMTSASAKLREYLLILGIHFQFEERVELEKVLRKVLDIPGITIKTLTIQRLKQVFTQSIYKSTSLSDLAISVPPTDSLTAEMDEMVPLHAVLHLLKTRQFSANGIKTVANWIFDQICKCSLPVHPHVPKVITALINANIPQSKKDFASLQKPISPWKIMKTCLDPAISPVAKTLLGYYLVAFSAGLLKQADLVYRNETIALSNQIQFPVEALRQVPMKRLLTFAETIPSLANSIYPEFTAAISYVLPELLIFDSPVLLASKQKERSPECIEKLAINYKKFLTQKDFKKIVSVMSELEDCSNNNLEIFWNSRGILENVTEECPRWLLLSMKRFWQRLLRIIPRQLWTETLNDLSTSKKFYKFNEYIENPLLAFQVDNKIFRSPVLLEMFLICLRGLTQSSKTFYSLSIITDYRVRANKDKNNAALCDAERIKANILLTTKAGVVQILLELMLPKDDEASDGPSRLLLREIQCQICFFIHEMFIDDHVQHGQPILCKLLHFQGYPTEAQPLLVQGVPSMHICMSFLPELFKYSSTKQRMFAIQLLAHLTHHYSIPQTLELCKLAARIGLTLVDALAHDEVIEFFSGVLPSFAMMVSVFPPLSTHVIDILERLRKISSLSSRMKNADQTVVNDFQQLDKYIDACFSKVLSSVKTTNRLISSN